MVSSALRTSFERALFRPKPFHGKGIWAFPQDQLNLFLMQEPYRICLGKDLASAEDMGRLAAACQPATFGLNNTDVLDESYRKAGKLDRKDFAINLDIVGSGLLNAVQQALFGWEVEPREIRAELYKLNVYGPGSFFKAHKDTPRGEGMFGSLVLNFPTKHEGGMLILRHNSQEVTLDSSKAEYASSNQVFWTAFYSDVQHEVLPVHSGHRVTLTYNLYFTTNTSGRSVSALSVEPILAPFKALLADKTCLPEGGLLGRGFLSDLVRVLKGNDHALFHAAKAAGLEPELAVAYDLGDEGSYMFDHVLNHDMQVESWDEMVQGRGITKISAGSHSWRRSEHEDIENIEWIIPRNDNTQVTSYYVRYGNEASLDTVYGDVVLTVLVPPIDERT